MRIEKKKIGKWMAIIHYSDEGVCISHAGEGGAIVMAETYTEAFIKFIKAMVIAEGIKNVMEKEADDFINSVKKILKN